MCIQIFIPVLRHITFPARPKVIRPIMLNIAPIFASNYILPRGTQIFKPKF